MAKKPRGPDYLEEYITDDKRHDFRLYAKAYRDYDLPYWTFVRMAKEAGATVSLRKTAVVDLIALDKYIEEQKFEPEVKNMSKARTKIEDMDDLLKKGKKYVRSSEAKELYSIGRHTLERWARDCSYIFDYTFADGSLHPELVRTDCTLCDCTLHFVPDVLRVNHRSYFGYKP